MAHFGVQHHLQKRKRIHEKHEPYPHPNLKKRVLDSVVTWGSAIIALFTVPQVYTIWVDQAANGVSVLTWSAYLVGALLWMTYGIMHKAKPIIITQTIMIILEIAIIVGAIVHG